MVWLQSAIPFFGILLLSQRTTALLISQRYHLINGSLTWSEAQNFCRVKYTDLATVNNMDDENELVDALGSHVTYSWIGLQRGATRRWMWSDGRGRAHFTMWNDGEPNNVAGSEWCAEMSETGSWNDIQCGEEKEFVCYELQQDGTERYFHYSGGKSWVNSQELCRSKHTDLAYISTEAVNSKIAELVSSQSWIGLFSDAWMWSDGRETSFRYWLSSTQYLGNCASIAASQQGRWVDAHCDEKATFVCQGGLKVKKMVIRISVHSDVDLIDSTVSDALLKKLMTGLKDQRITDFNLSWQSDKNGIFFQRHEDLEKGQERRMLIVKEKRPYHFSTTAGVKVF